MEGIKTIIPANGWTAFVQTEQGDQGFPVAAWALTTDNRIQGMIAVEGKQHLEPLPSLPVTYRHVSEKYGKEARSSAGVALDALTNEIDSLKNGFSNLETELFGEEGCDIR